MTWWMSPWSPRPRSSTDDGIAGLLPDQPKRPSWSADADGTGRDHSQPSGLVVRERLL